MTIHRPRALLPRKKFLHRLARSMVVGALMILVSLTIGMVGYHVLGGLSWIDAFLDASMILSGMGPLSQLHNDQVKFFAGCYAIYCGLALISTAGVMLAPLIHRYLHKFHLEDDANV
jgi:hypothetical protein